VATDDALGVDSVLDFLNGPDATYETLTANPITATIAPVIIVVI